MTKANILAIIKENNVNKDIKWNVVENNKKHIVIGNTYDESVRYEIKLGQGEGNDISVKANTWADSVAYLIQGHEHWCDFENIEVGISQAVKKVVKHFYYYY